MNKPEPVDDNPVPIDSQIQYQKQLLENYQPNPVVYKIAKAILQTLEAYLHVVEGNKVWRDRWQKELERAEKSEAECAALRKDAAKHLDDNWYKTQAECSEAIRRMKL